MSLIEIFGQLFGNLTAFDEENDTEQERKNFQEKPKRSGGGFMLAAREIIQTKRKRAEQDERESNEANDEEGGFRVGVHFCFAPLVFLFC